MTCIIMYLSLVHGLSMHKEPPHPLCGDRLRKSAIFQYINTNCITLSHSIKIQTFICYITIISNNKLDLSIFTIVSLICHTHKLLKYCEISFFYFLMVDPKNIIVQLHYILSNVYTRL